MSNRKLAVVISAAFTLLLTAKIIAEEPNYSWRQTDSSLALLNHERIVWQLNFDKKAGKTYFHPVALTDGTVLTWLSPPDHPWHRALWFSWKYINGLNYWEEDRKTGLSEGRTNLVDIKLTPHDDYSAQIEMNLSYHPPGKPAVLTEKRLISISKPDENGRYRIDWQSSFTAGAQDVLLDRTPIPGEKDGKSWGGYAGLSVRIAKDISDWQVLDSEGRKGIEAHGKKARWLDFSGKTANGKTAGITIFDHPDNLRHPSPWFVIMDSKVPFGYFSPAVLFHKPYTLAAGKSLELRYRIFIHPERGDKEMLEKEWKTFLKTTDIEVQFESAKMLKALGVAMVTYTGDAEIKFPDDMQPLHKYGSLSKRDLRWLTKNVAYVVKGKTTGNIRPNTVLVTSGLSS
ncbi:MAG: PmoA family protein [Sedimentisphaerales bacterium]